MHYDGGRHKPLEIRCLFIFQVSHRREDQNQWHESELVGLFIQCFHCGKPVLNKKGILVYDFIAGSILWISYGITSIHNVFIVLFLAWFRLSWVPSHFKSLDLRRTQQRSSGMGCVLANVCWVNQRLQINKVPSDYIFFSLWLYLIPIRPVRVSESAIQDRFICSTQLPGPG